VIKAPTDSIKVLGATSRWRDVASALQLPNAELKLMAQAFEGEQYEAARALKPAGQRGDSG